MSAKVLLICQTFTDIIRKVECYVFTRNIINLLRKGRQGTKSIAEALCNLWSATRWQEILISMNNGLERTLSECHCHKVYYKNVLLPLLTETHFGPVRLTHTCQLMGQKRWSEEITSLQIKHTHVVRTAVLALSRSLPLLCHGEWQVSELWQVRAREICGQGDQHFYTRANQIKSAASRTDCVRPT